MALFGFGAVEQERKGLETPLRGSFSETLEPGTLPFPGVRRFTQRGSSGLADNRLDPIKALRSETPRLVSLQTSQGGCPPS